MTRSSSATPSPAPFTRNKVLANSGAKPGDRLVFTKAIGTGVISTAIKRGKADFAWIARRHRSMTTLNKAAAEVIAPDDFDVA